VALGHVGMSGILEDRQSVAAAVVTSHLASDRQVQGRESAVDVPSSKIEPCAAVREALE
jgi:IMP cyclohydrolase